MIEQIVCLFKTWFNVYLAPQQAFSAITENPSKHKFWLPLLVLLIASVTSGLLTADLSRDYQKELLMSSEKYSSEQKAEIAKRFEDPVHPALIAFPVVGWSLVSIAALAGIYLFIGNFFGGGHCRYWTMTSIITYISMIDVLALAVKTPLMIIQNTALIDTSFALIFAERDMSNTWYQAAMQFDLFIIWKLILIILAFQTIYGFSIKKSAVLVFPVWFTFRLIAFALLSLSS